MTTNKYNKADRHKTKRLNEAQSFIETQTHGLYSYAAWLSGNEIIAEKAMEKTNDQIIQNIHANPKTRLINSDFFKTLKFYCEQEKFESASEVKHKKPTYEQDTLSLLIRKVLRKVPERYSEPLVVQVLSNLEIDELADFFEVGEPEMLMRLSAARKIVTALVTLELSQPQSNQIQNIKITSEKYANGLLAEMQNHKLVANSLST